MKNIFTLTLLSILLHLGNIQAQNTYSSYNYYGNGTTEYLVFGGYSKEVVYYTSANPEKRITLTTVRKNGDQDVIVKFPNQSTQYHLKSFQEAQLNYIWCIYPDGKKQLYLYHSYLAYPPFNINKFKSFNFHNNHVTEYVVVEPRGYQQKTKFLYHTSKNKTPIELILVKETKDGSFLGFPRTATVRFPGSQLLYKLNFYSKDTWACIHPNGKKQTYNRGHVAHYKSHNFYGNGLTEYIAVIYDHDTTVGMALTPDNFYYYTSTKPTPVALVMVETVASHRHRVKFSNEPTLYILEALEGFKQVICIYPNGKKQTFEKID